jgi:hypothetical protein
MAVTARRAKPLPRIPRGLAPAKAGLLEVGDSVACKHGEPNAAAIRAEVSDGAAARSAKGAENALSCDIGCSTVGTPSASSRSTTSFLAIEELYGDNSRYWVGPVPPRWVPQIDLDRKAFVAQLRPRLWLGSRS